MSIIMYIINPNKEWKAFLPKENKSILKEDCYSWINRWFVWFVCGKRVILSDSWSLLLASSHTSGVYFLNAKSINRWLLMVPFLSESGKQFLGMYPTVYLGIYLLAKFDTVFLSWLNDSQNIFASFLTIKILFKAV